MVAWILIVLGVLIEIFAVVRASRRDTHLELPLIFLGVASLSAGLIVNIVS